jgi:hypothetical protein
MKLLHRGHDSDHEHDHDHDSHDHDSHGHDGHDHDHGHDADRHGAAATPGRHAYRDTQAEHFGGMRWGSAFFGWLVAMGIAVIVLAVLAAAGVALGLTDQLPAGEELESTAQANAEELGIGGALALMGVLFVAYLAGGYVAGRMARFDGAVQGLGVWVIGLLMTVVAAVAGAVAGAEYNVLNRLDLPRIPIDEGDATVGGVLTLVAVVLLTLLGAALGGRLGEAYHRRIDRRTDELVARH